MKRLSRALQRGAMLALALLIPVSVASAQRAPQQPRITYRLVLWITPTAAPVEPVWLSEGDDFMRARLLPDRAVRLDAPVVDERGQEVMPAGAQLIGLEASQGTIYCLYARRGLMSAMGGVSGLLLGRVAPLERCLGDRDGDGRFDYRFDARGGLPQIPTLNGRTPARPDRVANIAYSPLEPATLTTEHHVMLRYMRRRGERYGFGIRFGSGDLYNQITDLYWVDGIMPVRGTPLGSLFMVEQAGEGERIRVAVRQTMPRQPFSVGLAYSRN